MPLHTPYKDDGLNKIYNLLFCDDIELYRAGNTGEVYPWDILLSNDADSTALQSIADDTSLEARIRLLAFHLLREKNIAITRKELLGVVVEVALAEGPDVLAAFSEGTARYINHSGKMIVWETQTTESEKLVAALFNSSINVVNQIGPWDKERRPFPAEGMVRLTFLVSDGLYFGEGPFSILQNDPMGGGVIDAATRLMTYLIEQPVPA